MAGLGESRVSGRRYRDRRPRKAHRLRLRDYVHDGLIPMKVVGFEAAGPGSVRIVGRLASGAEIRVVHPADLDLDVTRSIPVQPIRARGHFTLFQESSP